MPTQSIVMTFAGRSVVLADPLKYPAAADKANGYFCPLGAEPGVGYVLITRRNWNAIQSNRDAAFPLVLQAGQNTVTFPALYIVKAVKVSGGPANDPNSVYLLHLTDKRWHARMSDVAAQFNVRCPAPPATSGASLYFEDSLDSGSLFTWDRMVETLWEQMPILGEYPSLPITPHGEPEGFQFIGVSAMDALVEVLEKIGCTLAYNPLTNAVSIVEMGSTQAGLQAALGQNRLYLIDAEPFDVPAALVPATIRVYFHRTDQHYGSEKFTQRDSGTWVTSAWHKVDVATGNPGAIAGTVKQLWDDLPAIYSFAGSLTNSSAINARAAERAADYLGDVTTGAARRRTLYQGVVTNILPGSQIKGVHWRNFGDGLLTEVMNHPGLPKVAESANGLDRGPGKMTVAEALSTPDLARKSYPSFPPLVSLVAFDGSGGALTAGTDNIWPGHVYRVDPGGTFSSVDNPYEACEPCWLALSNRLTGGHISGMKLAAGDRFMGRLSGSRTRSGDTRPLYVIDRPENNAWAVTLGSGIAAGGSGSVTLSDGRTVTATNWSTDTALESGDKCLCWLDVPTSLFYLIKSGGSGESTPRKFRNQDSIDIPGQSYVEIIDAELDGGDIVLHVRRPTAAFGYEYAVTEDAADVAPGDIGDLQTGPDLLVRGEWSGSEPTSKQFMGPVPDEFHGLLYYPRFAVLGVVSTTEGGGIVAVKDVPLAHLPGVSGANISPKSCCEPGDYTVLIGPCDGRFDPGWAMPEAHNDTSIAINDESAIKVNFMGGEVYLEPWDC